MNKKCTQKSIIIDFPNKCVGNICRFWTTEIDGCYFDAKRYEPDTNRNTDPAWRFDDQDCGHD